MIELTMAMHIPRELATSTLQQGAQRVAASWRWYVVRGAGFATAGLLILLMLSGIGQVTGLTYRFLEPIKAWAVHKALALALCAAIVIHVLFILLDSFVSFSLTQALVPFVSNYSNHTSFLGVPLSGFALALGILAMYGVIVIVGSSLVWIDTRKNTKRRLHYLSYAVVVFIFLHALGVGSDLRYGTFRSAWIAIGVVLLLAIISRLLRAGTLRRSSPAGPDENLRNAAGGSDQNSSGN